MPTTETVKSTDQIPNAGSNERAGSDKNSIASLLKGKINLTDTVENLSSAFKNAAPYPHVVIDNLFSNEMLDSLCREIGRAHV